MPRSAAHPRHVVHRQLSSHVRARPQPHGRLAGAALAAAALHAAPPALVTIAGWEGRRKRPSERAGGGRRAAGGGRRDGNAVPCAHRDSTELFAYRHGSWLAKTSLNDAVARAWGRECGGATCGVKRRTKGGAGWDWRGAGAERGQEGDPSFRGQSSGAGVTTGHLPTGK